MLNIFNVQNKANDDAVKSPGVNSVEPNAHGDFRKYDDAADDFDSKELAAGLWYVEHKATLYKLLIRVLIALSVIFWVYSLWGWGYYLIVGYNQDQRMLQELSRSRSYSAINSTLAAKPLAVAETQMLAGGTNKYDAVALISNPNDNFFVQFNYSFLIDNNPTPVQTTFLLPGETRPIAALGLDAPGSAGLVLSGFRWRRINPHLIKDPIAWQAERLQFAVTDVAFRDPEPGTKSTRITFNITNGSPYSFKDPMFLAGIYSGGGLVSVIPFKPGSFGSLETKAIDLRSFVQSLGGTDVTVYPVINAYNSEEYFK